VFVDPQIRSSVWSAVVFLSIRSTARLSAWIRSSTPPSNSTVTPTFLAQVHQQVIQPDAAVVQS